MRHNANIPYSGIWNLYEPESARCRGCVKAYGCRAQELDLCPTGGGTGIKPVPSVSICEAGRGGPTAGARFPLTSPLATGLAKSGSPGSTFPDEPGELDGV